MEVYGFQVAGVTGSALRCLRFWIPKQAILVFFGLRTLYSWCVRGFDTYLMLPVPIREQSLALKPYN